LYVPYLTLEKVFINTVSQIIFDDEISLIYSLDDVLSPFVKVTHMVRPFLPIFSRHRKHHQGERSASKQYL
jgi:hypothetical protein